MKRLAALTLVSLVAVACGGGSDPSLDGTPELPGASHLGAWELTNGTVDGRAIPNVEGYRISLVMEGGSLSGTAACNGYGGDYTVDGGTVRIANLGATDMGCLPEVMEAEARYLERFHDLDGMVVNGDELVLTGPGVELRYRRLPPVPTAALIGRRWVLESVVEGDAVSAAVGEPATLELFEDGSLSGSTGCRTLDGDYRITGDEVFFWQFGADGECGRAVERQDNQVVTVLGDGFTVTIPGDRTMTATSSGGEALIFRLED